MSTTSPVSPDPRSVEERHDLAHVPLAPPSRTSGILEVFRRRYLLRLMVRREIRARYAGTAFGLVVAALTPSREAVLPVGSIAILTMAAAGGCWWPIDLEPAWMRRAALAFPTTWAMDAYNDLMIRRQPPRKTATPRKTSRF